MLKRKRVAAYIRVSKDRYEQKSSLKNQKEQIIQYAKDNDYIITSFYTDVETGTIENRDAFEKLLKDAQDDKFDIIISNPPYIPPQLKKTIQTEVTFEPDSALYTKDEKGLEFYEKIIKDAPKFLNPKGFILFELGLGQSSDVAQLLDNHGFKNIQVVKDLANIDRVIFGQLN